MTCNDLWDADARIRSLEKEGGPNAVSDYLGFMWRKGLLKRYPAAKTSKSLARYAYSWKTEEENVVQLPIAGPKKPVQFKQNINVVETKEGIIIEIGNISITVRTQ